jgi:NAD(P)-dependent dehydrogenase (short-subunit alcohol dehydrogenase family)
VGTLGTLVADINDAASVNAAIASILDTHGRIDALVHAAGDSPVRSILETTDKEWQASINSKLLGAVRLIRAAGHSVRLLTETGRPVAHIAAEIVIGAQLASASRVRTLLR